MPNNQILSGQARMIRPGEMVLDTGAASRQPINIDTRSAVGAVEADGRAFASADLGRAKIGEAVGGLGDHMQTLALKQMEAINITRQSDAQNLMTEAEGEMAAKLAKEPDETKWEDIAKNHVLKTRERIDKMALSPVAKAAIDSDFSRWEVHRVSGVKVDSARESIKKANQAIGEKVNLATATQDRAMLDANLDGAVASGFITKDAAALHRLRFDEEGKQKAKEAEALNFDNGQNSAVAVASENGQEAALKALDAGGFGKFSATQKERLRNTIQAVSKDRNLEDTATISDGIASGQITTPEQVDTFQSKHLRPADREALKTDIIKRQSAEEKARLNDSDVQFSIYGNLLARGQKWNKDAPDAEREYFEIHRESLQLPEGLRGEVTGPIERKRSAKLPGPDDTLTDYARDRLTRMYERGALGNFKVPGVGFTDGKKNPDTVNPEIQDSAARVLAKTKRGIDRWLKANPNADEESIDAQMQKIMAGHVDKKQASELLNEMRDESPPGLMPQKPTGGPPDTAETMTSGKVTKYGYGSDPNADPLSANRVGAFSGSEAEAAAAAGKDHPGLLKRGDLAVSPDVEKQLTESGVKPGDFVKVKLKNGKTRTVRWMDRTATDEQAKSLGLPPLRGRWDFYTPDGKEPDTDAGVVSFTRVSPSN